MRLVLFDFDGTLTRRDTLLPFLHFAVGTPRFALGMIWLAPVFAGLALRRLPNQAAKERVLAHFFAGWPEASLKALGAGCLAALRALFTSARNSRPKAVSW